MKKLQAVSLSILLAFVAGCNSIKVSNVTGEDIGYAKGILKGQGFEVEVIEETDAEIPSGQVLSQEPAAETSLKKGELVRLVVAKSPIYSLKGTITLIDSDIEGVNYCYGTGGYSDIKGGMAVTVMNEKGEILATGSVENGKRPPGQFSEVSCVLEFQLEEIPKSNFYSIEIGRRGKLNYSFEEIQKNNWELELSIG